MAARLQQWSLRSRRLGQWQSPEEEGVCLFGFVVGHPRHRNGKEVLTTPVIRCCANRIVTRSGNEYELGLTDPAYERRYPGALQRLLARQQQDPATDLARAPQPRHDGFVSRMRRFVASLVGKQRTS